MNKVEAYLHESPGWSWRLEWSGPFDWPAERWNQQVLAAVHALRELFEPLAMEIRLARVDEDYPSEDSWSDDLLLAPGLQSGSLLAPTVTSAEVRQVSGLAQDELERQLQKLVAERDAPSIMRLMVHGSRAFLTTPAQLFELKVVPGSTIQIPVSVEDGKHGVVGPLAAYLFEPPVGLLIDESLSVRIRVCWSYWMNGAGQELLQGALSKLKQLGWSLVRAPGGAP